MCGLPVARLHLFELVAFADAKSCDPCRDCGDWVRADTRRVAAPRVADTTNVRWH